MTDRPYAGQMWGTGVLRGLMPGAVLEIIGRDLSADCREHGVTEGDIELWANDGKRLKGFFVGDTSELREQGWTKVATL